MKREEEKNLLYDEHGEVYELIDRIADNHETTIEILMKANEEEISRHFNECEKYEAQLKAKDEEIDRLTTKLTLCDNAYTKVTSSLESAVIEIERLEELNYYKQGR